jgi:hypothetical protein
MLTLYGEQTPRTSDAKPADYLKDVTALTAIASQKNKTWQLNVLGGTYNELTDVEKVQIHIVDGTWRMLMVTGRRS